MSASNIYFKLYNYVGIKKGHNNTAVAKPQVYT